METPLKTVNSIPYYNHSTNMERKHFIDRYCIAVEGLVKLLRRMMSGRRWEAYNHNATAAGFRRF